MRVILGASHCEGRGTTQMEKQNKSPSYVPHLGPAIKATKQVVTRPVLSCPLAVGSGRCLHNMWTLLVLDVGEQHLHWIEQKKEHMQTDGKTKESITEHHNHNTMCEL